MTWDVHSMTDETVPALPEERRRVAVSFSLALARAICSRVAGGESVVAICESPGMPHQNTVFAWVKRRPRFAAMIGSARKAAGLKGRSQQLSTFCPATAAAILERLCEGETLAAICRDPAMPAFATVYRWRRTFADFAVLMREARDIQAERLCDLGLEVAEAVTPATAHATAVRLVQLRWTAGVLSPRRYGRFQPVAAEIPPQAAQEQQIIVRRFQMETSADGRLWRVMTYAPDPETGRVECEEEGPWTERPDPAAKAAALRG